jgi:hypothetical protein
LEWAQSRGYLWADNNPDAEQKNHGGFIPEPAHTVRSNLVSPRPPLDRTLSPGCRDARQRREKEDAREATKRRREVTVRRRPSPPTSFSRTGFSPVSLLPLPPLLLPSPTAGAEDETERAPLALRSVRCSHSTSSRSSPSPLPTSSILLYSHFVAARRPHLH